MGMYDLEDTDYIKDSIAEADEFTGETITLFTLSSSTSTPASLEPATMTYGSSATTANVRRISAREVSESGGIYKSDDLVIYTSGSYSQDVRIGYRTGTYNVVEKPAQTTIDGIDVRHKSVLRRG